MPKRAHEPVRTCVACRQEAGKRGLVRLLRDSGGLIQVDESGRAPGRGAYLHGQAACAGTARRRHSLERALRGRLSPEVSGWLRRLEAMEGEHENAD